MKRRINRSLVFVLFLVFFPVAVSRADERAIARVDGKNITSAQLDFEIAKLIPKVLFHKNVSDERMKEIRGQAFGNLKRREMIYAEALSRGYQADEQKVESRFRRMRERFGSEKDFAAALKNAGINADVLRDILAKEEVEERFLKAEVEDRAVPGEEELRVFYESNRERFREPEKVRVYHILISVDPSSTMEERGDAQRRAAELVQRLKRGEDFSELAWKYSADPYRVKGGDLGLVHRGRLEKPVEDLAFLLASGEIGGPVQTLSGYSIVKTGEKVPARDLSFAEAREAIRKFAVEKKRKELQEMLQSLLENKYKVEILDTSL